MKYRVMCPICGRFWKAATERMQAGKTCTKLCSSIKGYLSGDRKETGIELKVQQMLTELGYSYTIQKPLLGICVADVLVEPNVVIFADGMYWHSGTKMEMKDGDITRKLKRGGYVVCRLEEKMIDKQPGQAKELIVEAYGRRRAAKVL